MLSAIETFRQYYSWISKKPIVSSTRAHWSFLKTFLNNKKKNCILTVVHNNTFTSNFRNKAELFNISFAKQCTLINNATEIPETLYTKTIKTFSLILITRCGITKTKKLDLNKANGYDIISK